uniref:IMP dehydrogenase/GMP reductase n=2 Tax=Glycine max TaxID=3847 RepID=D3G9M4_SOYBN|nr:IMP dehydrogenase/GMP reductase [Glycine max]
MVRTRGLGCVLGHITDRGVGRGDRDDSDDAPQRPQPTASARRQRVAITAEHDEPVVPVTEAVGASVEPVVYADEPMARGDVHDTGADTPADTGTQAVEDEAEGFLGGPSDPSVLTEYADHVAGSVWTGEERPELKLSSHRRKVHSLGRPIPAIKGLVVGTGLSLLIACSIDTGDRGLLSSFVERLSGLRHDSVVDRTYACNGYVISMSADAKQALRDLSQTERYAWGVAALVHMYDHLNDASISSNRQLDSYITLLQCWIYEHFPSVAESIADSDYDEDSPRSCRWIATKKTVKNIRTPTYRERLDRLRISDVCWIPYGEHRPVRDFHMISCYSGLLRWVPVVMYYDQRGSCGSLDTLRSFLLRLWIHGCRMMIYTTGQASNPLPDGHAPQPQVIPQVPETDIPHVPEPGAPSTSARPTVDEPRHAVEVCYGIAERLERHLSLGVVTPGSSTHEVIEECLKMARSVTQDQLVYVRSRRRRCMDQT